MDPWTRQDISGLPRQSVREYAPPNDGEMEKTRAREIEGVSSWIRAEDDGNKQKRKKKLHRTESGAHLSSAWTIGKVNVIACELWLKV